MTFSFSPSRNYIDIVLDDPSKGVDRVPLVYWNRDANAKHVTIDLSEKHFLNETGRIGDHTCAE